MNDKHTGLSLFFYTHDRGPVRPEDPLEGIATAVTWQSAWTAAIAMAWSNEHDKQWLLNHPHDFFEKKCQWKVPEGLQLEVTDKPDKDESGHPTGWFPAGPGTDPKRAGWYLAKTKVVMYLPPRPDVSQQAVALADYLATGRTYPFSTC